MTKAQGLNVTMAEWPALKKALWAVVTGESLNDGHYINAWELTDRLYAAALAVPSACPSPKPEDTTYYTKGKDAAWFEALSDKEFAREASTLAMHLNDTGLGDDLDKWFPFQVVISDAADRIGRLASIDASMAEQAAALVDKHIAAAERCKNAPIYSSGVPMDILVQDLRELREHVAALPGKVGE